MTGSYEQRKRIKNVRWILFWVALAQTVATLIVNAAESFLPRPSADLERFFTYFQLGIIELVSLTIPILLYAHTGWSSTENPAQKELKLVPFSPLAGILTAVLAIGGQFVMVVLNIPAVLLMQKLGGIGTEQAQPLLSGFRDWSMGLICAAAFPAVFEEFILRGFVFSVYEKHSTFLAAVFSTVVFALLHGSVAEMPGILFLGAVLCLVLIRTGSLFAAMLYHFINNATALLLEYFMQAHAVQLTENPIVLIYIFAGAIVLFLITLLLFLRCMPKPKVIRARKNGKLFAQSIFSIPVMLCIALEIVLIFVNQRGA